MKRREVENDIEGLVRTLNNTLEFIREQDARSRGTRAAARPRSRKRPAPAPRPADVTPKSTPRPVR